MKNLRHHKYIEYFLKKLNKKYNKNIILYYNNKCLRTNVSYYEENNQHLLEYGDRLIEDALLEKKNHKYYFRYAILHEFGHIIHNLPYRTFKDKVQSEYSAERFALNHLKDNYYKNYLWACKIGYSMFHDVKWGVGKTNKYYRVAWGKIEEYL